METDFLKCEKTNTILETASVTSFTAQSQEKKHDSVKQSLSSRELAMLLSSTSNTF